MSEIVRIRVDGQSGYTYDDTLKAYHECGHVILQIYMRHTTKNILAYVTIREEGGSGGKTHCELGNHIQEELNSLSSVENKRRRIGWTRLTDEEKGQVRLLKRWVCAQVAISLAGGICHNLASNGMIPQHFHAESDYKLVDKILNSFCNSSIEKIKIRSKSEKVSRKIIRRSWSKIEQLATELERRKYLDANEVENIMGFGL